MSSKWILRLSIILNILFISGCIFIILNFKEVRVNPSDDNGESIQSISIYDGSEQSGVTTAKLEKSDFQWPSGKKMALSFTFDDAALSQIDTGIPLFDKYGVKATFYVSIWDVEKRIDGWKNAIKNGHEVGNHTMKHPCTINYDFVQGHPLEDYTLSRMSRELYSENGILEKLLGVRPVSFAYPCGQTFIGRGLETKSYIPLISEMFESGRGYEGGLTNPALCDMAQLPAEHLDGKSVDEIKELIETARVSGKWLILAGHGIGEGDSNTSQISTIKAICEYALDSANGIWVDNVHNIASYVREKRGEGPYVQVQKFNRPVNLIYSKMWSSYYVLKMKLKAIKNKL